MKKLLFLTISWTLCLVGCTNDPKEGQDSTVETAATSTVIDPATIAFVCQSAADPNTDADAPRHEVFLQMGTSKVKVADILNCEVLGKDMYAQNQIPPTAIAAVGGWWAGAGDYLYIIEEGGKYLVKKGSIAEESENNDFGYTTIMTFGKDGQEVF